VISCAALGQQQHVDIAMAWAPSDVKSQVLGNESLTFVLKGYKVKIEGVQMTWSLFLCGSAIMILAAKGTPPAGQLIGVTSSFRLFDQTEQILLQLQVHGKQIHTLSVLRNSGLHFYRQFDTKGNLVSSYSLPQDAHYSFLGIRISGVIVFPTAKKGRGANSVEERTPTGELVRSFDERPGVQRVFGYCVVGESLLALRRDSSLDIADLRQSPPVWRRLLGDVGSYRGARMFASVANRVVILDVLSAEGASIEITTGTSTPLKLSSPQIESAREHYAKTAAAMPDGGQRMFILLGAVTVQEDGTLYTAIFPYDPKVGLNIVTFNADGTFKSSVQYQLPVGWLGPSHMAIIERELYLAFPNGEVLVRSGGAHASKKGSCELGKI
jgi:hypothetical protein